MDKEKLLKIELDKVRKAIAKAYEDGEKIPAIVEKYNKQYGDAHERYTGIRKPLTKAIVSRNCTIFCDQDKVHEIDERLSKEVTEMRKSGMKYKDIAEELGISENKAIILFQDRVKKSAPPREVPNPVTQKDVDEFLDKYPEGSKVITMTEKHYIDKQGFGRTKMIRTEVTLKKMYPFGADTDHGFMRYTDIVRWKRMVMKNEGQG